MKVLFKNATAFWVVNLFILTHICLLYSAIADCGISTFDDLEEAEAERSKLKLTDRPIAQNNLEQARDDYNDFVDRIKYIYIAR